MLVRATLTDIETSGSIVGRLSAIGTVGAISGTFLTGFVLLGLVPTSTLIVALGGSLVVVGLALTVALRSGGDAERDAGARRARHGRPRARRPLAVRHRESPTTASPSSPITSTRTAGCSSSIG